jgi:uncharacterized membrane protein YebE (DUF533 family)
MKNLNSVISNLSSSGFLSGLAGGVAGGALTSMVASKKGRKVGKSALKLGALAAVGGVAWKAYQSYSNKNTTTQAQSATGANAPITQSTYIPSQQQATLTYSPNSLSQKQFNDVLEDESDNSGQMLLLRAMISAAYADGHIDESERQTIFDRVQDLQLSVAEKASLFDELRSPLEQAQLVQQVPNSETAIEVYAASALAIDINQASSRGYLDSLARNLFLPPQLVQQVESQVQASRQQGF